MGILLHVASGTRYRLNALTSIGRRERCDIPVQTPYASNHHAELRWSGARWELRDMGSSNGTFLGQRRLTAEDRLMLKPGVQVAFGDPDDPFELIDGAPPSAWAVNADGEVREAEGGVLELPDPDHPLFQIFENAVGRWQIASSQGTRLLSPDETLDVGDTTWTVRIPTLSQATLQRGDGQVKLRDVMVRFHERAGDRVEIAILRRGALVGDLGHRNHHELLLRLAEERFEDEANPEVAGSDRGWVYVDELIDRLGLHRESQRPRNLVDQYVSRSRKAFIKAGVVDGGEVIRRRVTAAEGQIRLEVGAIDIVRDDR